MKVALSVLAFTLISVVSAAELKSNDPNKDVNIVTDPKDQVQSFVVGAPDQPDYVRVDIGKHAIDSHEIHKEDLPKGGQSYSSSHMSYYTSKTIPEDVIEKAKEVVGNAEKKIKMKESAKEESPKEESAADTKESEQTK